jgi:ABC-type branched-subunit amino acid transport system substrate-binding protein
VAILSGTVLSSCGLRVPSSEVRSATAAAEGSGGSGSGSLSNGTGNLASTNNGASSGSAAPTGGSGSTGSSGSSGGSAAASSGSSGAGSAAVAAGNSAGGPAGAGSGGSAVNAPAPAGGNGGATDVGVTATSITVGNVSDIGGPVPGLFAGGPLGTQAYFNYINSQGGVYGRKIKLATSDDQLQCSQNEAAYSNNVSSVFAFVGSWSLDDNCGAQVMSAHPKVPMVQTYLSQEMASLPNAFGEAPYSADVYTGPWLYFKQKYPGDIGSVGTLVGNQSSAVAAWQHAKTAIQSLGYNVAYEDDFPPAQSNFTADVIRMKADNIKMVVLLAVNAPDAAIFASEAAQQGFKPNVWICPVCYFGGYINQSGGPSSVANHYAYVNTADFLGDATVPEVGKYLTWLHQTNQSFIPDEFSAYSWANAALFVHALQAAGPDLTQSALLTALKGTGVFNDGGMVTSANIGARSPSTCYNILQVQNGGWAKVDDPSSGYRCDGTYVP